VSKPKLAISFSGGRTSAVMTKLCVEKFSDTHDIAITFANTGSEHENTLKFVDQCDKHFGWNVVWLEAVVNPEKGKGIRHKIVDFATAARNGEPLEADFAKHGLPGPGWLHCTRDTKELPIKDYLKSVLGWKWEDFWIAIGIRADEIDRVSANRKKLKFVYPLVDAGWTKEDVKRECASWPFDLDLKGEHYGNCTWCWKKSLRKHLTLAKESPEIFDFPRLMEEKYAHITTPNDPNPKRQMFRKHMTTVDIIEMAKTTDFEPYVDTDQLDFGFSQPSYDVFLDTGSSCGESCEIGADD
tara:strand:- start:295 stop:1188 length:894 start_codon:yes stop_codon:yes gene_type:complete